MYLKNKKVVFKIRRKSFSLPLYYTSEKDIKNVLSEVQKFFGLNKDKKVAYISNIFDYKTNTTRTYTPTPNQIISNAGTSFYSFTPHTYTSKPFLDINVNFKNLFGQRVTTAVVVNVMGNNVVSLSNKDLIGMAYDLIKEQGLKLNKKGESVGVIFANQNLENNSLSLLGYAVSGEFDDVRRLAVVRRTFEIPKFNLDEIVFGYKSNTEGSRSYGIGFKIFWSEVQSAEIDLETGAFYQGKWGGSKFKVSY